MINNTYIGRFYANSHYGEATGVTSYLRGCNCGADDSIVVATLSNFKGMYQIMLVNDDSPVPLDLLHFSID